jgi:hypothetical protein
MYKRCHLRYQKEETVATQGGRTADLLTHLELVHYYSL